MKDNILSVLAITLGISVLILCSLIGIRTFPQRQPLITVIAFFLIGGILMISIIIYRKKTVKQNKIFEQEKQKMESTQNHGNSDNSSEQKGTKAVTTQRWTIWTGFTILHLSVSAGIWYLLVLTKINYLPIIIALVIFFLGWSIIIIKAWTQIQQMDEYILEVFGAYIGYPLTAGLHFIFPYLNFMFKKAEVYMGTQVMPLYLAGKKEEGEEQTGSVDFGDDTAPVAADVFFRIMDSEKATYQVDNVFIAVKKKISAALRAYLGNYDIDDAIILKTHFDLNTIMNGILIAKNREGKIERIGLVDDKNLKQITTIKDELASWGVKIESVVVTDILLSEKTQEKRGKVLDAKKDAEAATHTGQARITLSEADKVAFQNLGEGRAAFVQFLVNTGKLTPGEAAELTRQIELYGNIGTNAVIIDSQGKQSKALDGSRFGAGFGKTTEAINTN